MNTLKGSGASEGFAIGRAVVLREAVTENYQRRIPPGTEPAELARFQQALAEAKRELAGIKERSAAQLGAKQAEIFAAHLLMLEDPALVDAVSGAINGGSSAEHAVHTVTEEMAAVFAGMDNAYMRERAADLRDIGRRLMAHLAGHGQGAVIMDRPGVIFARDLLPSDTALLDPANVLGFVTALGGKTSHSSILARAMCLPAVVGVGTGLATVQDGDMVIVDGGAGVVIINPDAQTLEEYQQRLAKHTERRTMLATLKNLPSVTADGKPVEIAANIGTPKELPGVLAVNADGIGLFRTEFVFMDRGGLPSEEEQFKAYKSVLEALPGKKVVIRTLDAGGDKGLPYLNLPAEANPALGLRAIRLCLARRDIFKTQLRALLRAGVYGQLSIMFPMVAGLEELQAAKAVLKEVQEELAAQAVPHNPRVPVGIMIEIPSAAVMADILAPEVDFFSIGTNDLVQYTVAVDRMNEQVAYLSDYFHPAVLRLIANVSRAAHAAGKWVGMCGEMAGDPLAAVLLIGLGLDELSMNANAVLEVKRLVREINTDEAKAHAQQALRFTTAVQVKEFLEREMVRFNL